MLFWKFLLLLFFVHYSVAIQCLNGSISVLGGEVSFEPVQQILCNSNNFCVSSYANNGDTILFNMNCDLTNICKKNGCYIDNTTVTYDMRICCCGTDLCNNLSVNEPIRRTFAPDFMFGVATASYQVEGGAFADGKGPSIWDTFTHLPGTVKDNSTGDIACNSYELYETDIANIKYMGLNHYRFSLSWPRMFPSGRIDDPNPLGILYYDKLINLSIANNIEPMVTLYHWDMPQSLMDIGGFLNPDIKHYFANYSRFVFNRFGDRVKKWITLNEPTNMAQAEYCADQGKIYAPGEFKAHCAWSLYLAAHNMLLSHLEMARVYKNDFQATQKGIIGLALDGPWFEPYKNLPENQDAANRAFEFGIGWLGHPIYSPDGDYSEVLKERIANMSLQEKRVTSRLPVFTQDEIDGLKNSADFIGCNYYAGAKAKDLPTELENDTLGTTQEKRDSAAQGLDDADWTSVSSPTGAWPLYTPWTLRELLNYYRTNYGNKPVYITENGCMEVIGQENLNDQGRIHFLRGYLLSIAAAIEDGCNVKGHTVWSLMDNFEWTKGYTMKFGLYQTNFSDPNRTRTPKASVEFYRSVAANRYIDGF